MLQGAGVSGAPEPWLSENTAMCSLTDAVRVQMFGQIVREVNTLLKPASIEWHHLHDMCFPCQWPWGRSTRLDTRASGVAFTPHWVRVSTCLEPVRCEFQRAWDPAGLGFKPFETRRFRFSNEIAGFRRVTGGCYG